MTCLQIPFRGLCGTAIQKKGSKFQKHDKQKDVLTHKKAWEDGTYILLVSSKRMTINLFTLTIFYTLTSITYYIIITTDALHTNHVRLKSRGHKRSCTTESIV